MVLILFFSTVATMAVAQPPRSKKLEGLIPQVNMLSLCLCKFSPGSLDSSHNQKLEYEVNSEL